MAVLDENNKVVNIIICNDDENETANLIEYNENNPAYINGDYLEGYFYPPKPFESWTRYKGNWEPPIPMPIEGMWHWDESIVNWIEQPIITE